METIRIAYHDNVAVLTLSRGVTHALNPILVEELTEALKTMENDPQVRGLVLTGTGDKFFSIGLDIPELLPLSREDFQAFYHAFNLLSVDLFTFPRPTVAALTGHATAAGCILALCCDYRFISEGRKLAGLNEIKLGLPIPYPALCILEYLASNPSARDIVYQGEFHPSEELLGLGLVDRILPADRVLPEAIEEARLPGGRSPDAFAIIKGDRVEPVKAQIMSCLEAKDQVFVEHWFSTATRERLKEATKKFRPAQPKYEDSTEKTQRTR